MMLLNSSDFCNFFINWIPSPRLRKYVYRILGMKIHPTAHIMRNCIFLDIKKIIIKERSIIGHNCLLDGRGFLYIGRDVNISSFTKIITATHLVDDPQFRGKALPVIIEDNVWIATSSIILPGVRIKKGAVVGAGSVVTKDVEEFCVVAGVPARIIKKRNPHLNYQLHSKPSRFL